MDEVEDIKRQIIANHVADIEFQYERKEDERPHREPPRKDKTEYHRDGIRDRINDAVSRVALRQCLFAVVIDYHRRVFDDFPRGLDAYCEE